jgi:hypothetical protein
MIQPRKKGMAEVTSPKHNSTHPNLRPSQLSLTRSTNFRFTSSRPAVTVVIDSTFGAIAKDSRWQHVWELFWSKWADYCFLSELFVYGDY